MLFGQGAAAGVPSSWRRLGEPAISLDAELIETVRAEEAARSQVDVPQGQVLDVCLSHGQKPWLRLRVKAPLVDTADLSRAVVDVRKRFHPREPRPLHEGCFVQRDLGPAHV